jgi:serine/threonine protein kinase
MQSTRTRINEIKAQCSPLLDGYGKHISNLGSGSFGTVNHIICEENFALKIIHLKKNIKDMNSEEELLEHLSCAFFEYQVMRKNLPNVVRSYQCHFDEEKKVFSFTMDFMKKGDLETVIKNGRIPFDKFYKLFKGILTGLKIQYRPFFIDFFFMIIISF